MSKPDDIPQDVWDCAYAVESSYNERDGWKPSPWVVERHCRIIMDATAKEREACAQEMDRRWRENANTPETRAAYSNAATAIRSRT